MRTKREQDRVLQESAQAGSLRRNTIVMSETKKGKRKRDVEEDEESELSHEEDIPTQVISTAKKALQKLSEEEINRKVKGLIRLALFSERKKTPIRREDMVKKVLQEHSRAFQEIFEQAQDELRDIFGMEMVEMPSKEKKDFAGTGAARRANANKGASTNCKSYALISILPQQMRNNDLIQWHDEEAMMGLLTVILSLIFVNGQTLSDDQLRSYTNRLHIRGEHECFGELDKTLMTFVKQGYLDRQKSGLVDQVSEKEHFEYRWGPRAKVEFPENSIIQFIKTIYGRDAGPDLAKQIQRASGGGTD
ncbi:1000_t:CDS:2 [Ambispora leptoticha]|uniref:1000_t:CDS:1 n=1 Tax=Ambispora leptoticha TaxID=144679 RepID=A0A9N9AFC7_9GLOM|nr:1000_t:CDS:2 [Ambispora leptoticha]